MHKFPCFFHQRYGLSFQLYNQNKSVLQTHRPKIRLQNLQNINLPGYGIYNYDSYFKNTKWDCIINIILCLRFTNHTCHKPGTLATAWGTRIGHLPNRL
ncbi:MAG: hypothetical protein JWP37_2574 [Mucilaginibacter sp.]|nr:hypothetical protein [Mucilaginibacter sp.]